MQNNITGSTPFQAHRLHLEVLQEKYGDIQLTILRQDESAREALFTDGLGIARTYSISTRNKEWKINEEITALNWLIQDGAPIGTTFRDNGFEFRRNLLDVYIISLTPWLRRKFATTETFAKAYNIEFIIKKGDLVFNYAMITDICSPELQGPVITEYDTSEINFSFHALQASGFTRNEIWSLLENEDNLPLTSRLPSERQIAEAFIESVL